MKTSKYITLLHKRLKGNIEPNEEQALDEWLDTHPDKQLSDQLEQTWDWTGKYKSSYEPDTEKGLVRFKAKLSEEKQAEASTAGTIQLRPSWWAAAASLLILAAGLWWWVGGSAGSTDHQLYATSSGEIRQVELPDGSAVTLNESSDLAFTMEGDARKATFSGEAYFLVASDPDRPFVIDANGTHTRVVGTAFNLRAYPEESTVEVEVEEGTVELTGPADTKAIQLTAKERGICKPQQGKLYKVPAGDLNALAWRTHELQFTSEPFGQAMQEIERFFRIELTLEQEGLADCSYNGAFQSRSVEQLLENLELIFGFKIKKTGERMYLLQGGRCR